MVKDYRNIGFLYHSQRYHDLAIEYHNKALAIHEELKDKVGMAADYANIGVVHASFGELDLAIQSVSKGLELLQELEQKTGYHHPETDSIREYFSELEEQKGGSDHPISEQ